MDRKYIGSVRLSSPVDEGSYLHDLPVVQCLAEMKELPFSKDVAFLVGENGTGKSTLIEAIAVAYGFNAEGGTRNFSFSTSRTHSDLYRHLTLSRSAYPKDGFFLRAESFYNAASYIDELDDIPARTPPISASYGGKSLHVQSHGESFLSLVENRFGGNGLYLLDEPESALSPNRLMSLLVHIRELVKNNSQFIIATHSPILMAYPDAEVYHLSEDGIRSVAGFVLSIVRGLPLSVSAYKSTNLPLMVNIASFCVPVIDPGISVNAVSAAPVAGKSTSMVSVSPVLMATLTGDF